MSDQALPATTGTLSVRAFAWIMVAATLVYLINNYLIAWQDWPGPASILSGNISVTGLVQVAFYLAAIAIPILYVRRTEMRSLRADSRILSGIVAYIIRAAFWAVLLIGLADMVISFLRVEELLPAVVGPDLADSMNFNKSRAPLVHYPLMVVALLIAAVTRSLGFHWLAMLVVMAELQIVLSRFIFSYEQAFMGDLVRFWYGALFLFASAYTLYEDGHVRVDVLYAGFSDRMKGRVNAIGSILLGILFCWVIMVMGMGTKSSIINAPLLSYEVSQSGFGMYVKYLMAGFLGVFAISMMVQFCAYLLESVADWRGDPGSRLHAHDDEIPVH